MTSPSMIRVRAPFPTAAVVTVLIVTVLLAVSAPYLDYHPSQLIGWTVVKTFIEYCQELWPADSSRTTLVDAGKGLYQTLGISVAGTFFGAVIGVILMPFCSTRFWTSSTVEDTERTPPWRRAGVRIAQTGARLVANVFRTVPYFVWALLFMYMVGQGPFPGALAIAIHTGGVFARLYSTALDQVDPRPIDALYHAGARRTHVLLFGMLPAVYPSLISYTLYRWEVNIRESAVLGLVGAGGLGYYLKYAMETFDRHGLFTHLLALMALVLAVDALSARLRRMLV